MTEREPAAIRLPWRLPPSRMLATANPPSGSGYAENALDTAMPRIRGAIALARRHDTGVAVHRRAGGPPAGDTIFPLRALAAARHAEKAALDDYPAQLARAPRLPLAHRVQALADVLAVSGRLLRSPSPPALALMVARPHGFEPGMSATA